MEFFEFSTDFIADEPVDGGTLTRLFPVPDKYKKELKPADPGEGPKKIIGSFPKPKKITGSFKK